MSTAVQGQASASAARPYSWLPTLLGAFVGVGLVKAAILSGATAGLAAQYGCANVAWGGKLLGLAVGAAAGWLAGRVARAAR